MFDAIHLLMTSVGLTVLGSFDSQLDASLLSPPCQSLSFCLLQASNAHSSPLLSLCIPHFMPFHHPPPNMSHFSATFYQFSLAAFTSFLDSLVSQHLSRVFFSGVDVDLH